MLFFILSGCASTGFNSQTYTVRSGDTLYFVAWKYKLDPQDLAKWNSLSPPYTIYPGDRILIHPETPLPSVKTYSTNKDSETHTVRKGETLYGIARHYNLSTSKLARINRLRSPYTVYPGQKLSLKGEVASTSVSSSTPTRKTTKPKAKKSPSVVTAQNTIQAAPGKWIWPTSGTLVKGFKGSKSTQQGIDIAGEDGQLVRSAAPGEVVYSGTGLINYGQLVIVKHNNVYLSAYAYNKDLLVKEGEKVKAGQPIAKMGRLGQSKPKLHFEIRKYGKPVNPLGYLPKRS